MAKGLPRHCPMCRCPACRRPTCHNPKSLPQRLWRFRRLAEDDWRIAFDGLRPHTTALWRNLDDAERRRFLRHLRPYWEAHRHRLAPPVADRFESWIASGRLTLAAGRLTGATREAVTWRGRGETVKRRLLVVATRDVARVG